MLITQEVWCLSIAEMEYLKPVNKSLMHVFCGHSYIDIKSSFSTFISNTLDKKISKKLVKFWIEKLRGYRELHDKIEFDIADTTFAFDLNKRGILG